MKGNPEAVREQDLQAGHDFKLVHEDESCRKLSICMVSDDFLPAATGVGIHVQIVSKELARLGHRVSVIASRRDGQPEFEIWNGVRVYRTFTVKLYGYYQAMPSRSTIRRILAENAPDIIHYHYLGVLLKRTRAVARSLDVRNVYTYHMTADHLTQPLPMKPFRGLISRQIRDFCNGCDLVLAPSQKLVQQIESDGVTTPALYLSNPIELDDRLCSVEPSDKRGFTVLFAGRLAPEKNIPYLLHAFAKFSGACPNSELWLAGEGDQEKRLKTQCRELGIEERVKFLGFLDRAQLSSRYAAADVFVLPSLVETQGMVAMEAMQFGVPVIVSDRIVSARELVDDGGNGFLVSPESVDDLAGKLFLLSRDEALCIELGARGRQKAEGFAPGRIVGQLVGHYGVGSENLHPVGPSVAESIERFIGETGQC